MLAREDDPCRGQCRRDGENSQANLGSKEEVLGFLKLVWLELGFSVGHWEIFVREGLEENREKTENKKGEKRKVTDGEKECEVMRTIYSGKKKMVWESFKDTIVRD